MCNIDFDVVFGRWRESRKVEYEQLDRLLDGALELARIDDVLIATLQNIQGVVEKMKNTDNPRFIANGITETTLAVEYKP